MPRRSFRTSRSFGVKSKSTRRSSSSKSFSKRIRTGKKVKVVSETTKGRNTRFSAGRRLLSRSQFVKEIRAGLHPCYHVRMINGIATPASNPDGNTQNNLG